MEDREMITIPLEEYKELLMIKGRYEELKKHQLKYGIDWGIKESTSFPIRELNNPIVKYTECPPIVC